MKQFMSTLPYLSDGRTYLLSMIYVNNWTRELTPVAQRAAQQDRLLFATWYELWRVYRVVYVKKEYASANVNDAVMIWAQWRDIRRNVCQVESGNDRGECSQNVSEAVR